MALGFQVCRWWCQVLLPCKPQHMNKQSMTLSGDNKLKLSTAISVLNSHQISVDAAAGCVGGGH